MRCLKIVFLMENYGTFLYAKIVSWLTELTRFGRDNFQESMKIAHRMDHDKIHWNSFRFMVFDIPTSKGRFYSERYQQLRMTGLPIHVSLTKLLRASFGREEL